MPAISKLIVFCGSKSLLMAIVRRQLEHSLRALLPKYPVLAVTGPRQSGKTTLLKSIFPDYTYVSLEDTDTRSFATDDPIAFLEKYPRKVIFDEAQRVPELFSYLQTAVDKSGEMGQFVLSGSQNFHLMERITQSLAGRVAIFRLLPFDLNELRSAGWLPDNWQEAVVKGFYPAVYDRDIMPPVFYSNYLQTYVNRDISNLSGVQDLRRFQNFIALCAGRIGQLLNISNLANECGISQPTAKSWLSILESSYIVFLLQPYYENFNKRIVKTPKLYFYDTGLAAFLLGIRSADDITNPVIGGGLFENLAVAELHKQNYHQYQLKQYWFWRDSSGNEIDLMTKNGLAFDIFEIKSTKTVLPTLFKGLASFASITNGKVNNSTLIYGGQEPQTRTHYQVVGWNGIA
jgi:predicted AAA+ superfamily ATPase